MMKKRFSFDTYDEAMKELNRSLIDRGIVDRVRWKSADSSYLENTFIQLLFLYIEEYDQLGNIIDITSVDEGSRFAVYINVMDIEKSKRLANRCHVIFNDFKVIFVEKMSKYDERLIRWQYIINDIDLKEEVPTENKHVITMSGIRIGDITIDQVKVESTSDNIAESIEEAFLSLVTKINTVPQKDTPKVSEYKKEEPIDSDIWQFVEKCFSGCDILDLGINTSNVTSHVKEILPRIESFLYPINDGKKCNILITNTGSTFIRIEDKCFVLSMRDGRIHTQIVHKDFIDLLTSGSNSKYKAINITLYVK